MLTKSIQAFLALFLSTGILSPKHTNRESTNNYNCYVDSSAFTLGNFVHNSPSFYQLNFWNRLTSKDIISLDTITWKYDASLGISYVPSHGANSENYPVVLGNLMWG